MSDRKQTKKTGQAIVKESHQDKWCHLKFQNHKVQVKFI